jgi:hypothetical protein
MQCRSHFAGLFPAFGLGFSVGVRCCGPAFVIVCTALRNRSHASGTTSISDRVSRGFFAMSNLTDDPWVVSNSPLPADKLHAIGTIAFRWNECEFWLFLLLCAVSKLPRSDAWAMAHDLGDVAICTRVQVFATFRGYHPDAMALIENVLKVYDLCRQNRNSIVHAWTRTSGPDPSLARKSKKPDDPEATPFPSTLTDLRRVADDVKSLSIRLWLLNCFLEDGSMAKPLASPKKLPLPELLWKPPPQDSTKPKRPPRPSGASRRKVALARKT